MGTTTFYLRHNDHGRRLSGMTKKELKIVDELSPYCEENNAFGWKVPLELHNGNIYVLIFWKGRLMRLDDAPKKLKEKYYNKYTGKTLKAYEWTLLKRFILNEISYLDKQFKKDIRKTNIKKKE